MKATENGRLREQVFCAFLGELPREDFIPYVADFFLQLEDVKWTIIAGVVNGSLVVSVRNLGYSRNAGEFVRKVLREARQRRRASRDGQGGRPDRRVPPEVWRPDGAAVTTKILEQALQFLHEGDRRDRQEGARARQGPRSQRALTTSAPASSLAAGATTGSMNCR